MIDDTACFVRQLYHDFLNRDRAAGLATQGELAQIGDALEMVKKLGASWTTTRKMITQYREDLEIE